MLLLELGVSTPSGSREPLPLRHAYDHASAGRFWQIARRLLR